MTYEYTCQACGHHWEAEQSIKESALKDCVSCGADKAKRLVSGGTGFLLKGGGWYADGYGSSKAAGSSTKSESSSDSSSSTSSSETKASGGSGSANASAA